MVSECQEIPPRCEKEVMARVTLPSTQKSSGDAIIDAKKFRPGHYVARTLLPESHRDVKIRIANTTSKPLDACLGQALPVTNVIQVNSNLRNTTEATSCDQLPADIVDPVLQKLPPDVTPNQRDRMVDFLEEFDDMFSRGTYDMGRTNLVVHTIDTGDHRPIRQPLRRHPRAHLDEIDRQVDEVLQNGFVEPAASPWASNVVLVRKKDRSFRLYVDYRQLNSVTYKDTYSLPHIDTCLDSVNGAVCFQRWIFVQDITTFRFEKPT